MNLFKSKSIPLPNATRMQSILADLRSVQLKHDARLTYLAFLDRAAQTARNLKALGLETDESIDRMFAAALVQAKQTPRTPPKSFNPDVEPSSAAS